ncbi:MAG TPA: hypothetical protein VK031_02985 [Tissierellaceae bacterium]|nr:hypothetical protein [Tissierellaceae bacterium]
MNNNKLYRRKEAYELRSVTQQDIEEYEEKGYITSHETSDNVIKVLIKHSDEENGSPKIGDMIAKSTKNMLHQWLIEEESFKSGWEKVR